MYLVQVQFPHFCQNAYTYHYTELLEVGSIVLAEFGKKEMFGLVIGYTEPVHFNTKSILKVTMYKLPLPFLEWLKKAAEYYLNGLGDLLKLSLIKEDYLDKALPAFYRTENGIITSISKLLKLYGKRNFLKMYQYPITSSGEAFYYEKLEFTGMTKALVPNDLAPLLIYGPTGSGKTELYFNEINNLLVNKKQVLLMLPEVLLGENFTQRIFDSFGFWPHLWHHQTHEIARQSIWDWAISGEPGLLVGSRSSIWLPFKNLGLIVLDEEHDPSYKQEHNPIYNARDLAILRCKYESAGCILVSATPSLETWKNVLNQKYNLYEIKGESQVESEILEINNKKWLSDELIQNISQTLTNGNQCLLFLNRKGFSSKIICNFCHEILHCRVCSVPVTLYKNNTLKCSYCHYQYFINNCPNCSAGDWNLNGIGIEQVEERVKSLFPNKTVVALSSDNIMDGDYIKLIYNGEIDIVISTQILAKSYTFPKLTLVAILQFEKKAHQIDPRSNERIYQIFTQVRGRTGRVGLASKFLIQSFSQDHESILFMNQTDFKQWAKRELQERLAYQLPPYFQIIRFIIKSKSKQIAISDSEDLYVLLKSIPRVEVFPPTPSIIQKINNYFRYSILLKNDIKIYPQRVIKSKLNNKKYKSRITIDVDPQNFY